MKIEDLYREHKFYCLAERGLQPKHFRETWRILMDFSQAMDIDAVADIQTATVRAYLQQGRRDRDWSAKTFHTYRQYLQSFMNWCLRNGYVSRNPVTAVEKPRLDRRLPRFLTTEEARKVLFHATYCPWRTAFEKSRNPTILATFLMTGLRLQELINLTTTDIDLKTGEIWVRQGKGRKDRIVPIYERLHPILQVYLSTKLRLKKYSDAFFPGSFALKPLQPRDIYRICRRVGTQAGVKFSPHMLRHTFGREMIENDFPIYKLMEIMGHSSITTTQIYLSVSRQSLRKSFKDVSLY